jgi:hypothetical protein
MGVGTTGRFQRLLSYSGEQRGDFNDNGGVSLFKPSSRETS